MNNLSISYLFHLFLHRIVIIIAATIVCGAIAFGYCHWFATPIYTSSAQIIVSNGALINDEPDDLSALHSGTSSQTNATKVSSSDITASIYLANICVGILKTPEIYQNLATALDNTYSYHQLMSMISVSLSNDDEIFININVKNSSPQEAAKITNAFTNLAPSYINKFLPLSNSMITATADSASLSSPRTMFTTIIAALAGVIISYIIVLIIDINDTAIKGEQDFADNYNIPILGIVPDFNNPSSKSGGYSNAIQQ